MANLRDIMDRVRAEAKLDGPDTHVGLIITTLNEVYRTYTARRRFDQLYKPYTPLVALGAGAPSFTLPADLQVLQKDNISISLDGAFDARYALFWKGERYGSEEGQPRSVVQRGNVLDVYPYSDVEDASLLYINYWRIPNPLLTYTQTFEIPELEPVVVRETISVLARQGASTNLSAEYLKDAERHYRASFGVDPQRG